MYFKSILLSLLIVLNTTHEVRAEVIAEDLNSAVIYAYFRVGDDDKESPGISLTDFNLQIDEMTDENTHYNVTSIDTILKAQDSNSPLPPRTIALTFEGSDSSFIRNVYPTLKDKNIPFTLFVSAGLIDQAEKTGDTTYLTWNDIRTIAKSNLATIAMTSYAYHHVDGKSVADLASDTNRARDRFRTELNSEPKYFSYPYGETTPEYFNAISKQGFVASFGQQSGAMGKSTSRMTIPRFTVVDNFTDLDRFKMTALSLPFPYSDIQPSTTVTTTNPPHPGFTVGKDITDADLKKMKCFASGIEKLDIEKIGTRHFEIRFSNGFEDSKGRLNCTLPAPPLDGTDDPRWRWLGFLFAIPDGV